MPNPPNAWKQFVASLYALAERIEIDAGGVCRCGPLSLGSPDAPGVALPHEVPLGAGVEVVGELRSRLQELAQRGDQAAERLEWAMHELDLAAAGGSPVEGRFAALEVARSHIHAVLASPNPHPENLVALKQLAGDLGDGTQEEGA